MTLRLELDDLSHPAVVALLEEHLADMYATSPAESVHALDLDELRAPGLSFWSAWEGEELVGCGALKALAGGDFELKSMRTAVAGRGRGIAGTLLGHLIGQARAQGGRRVLLETGVEDYFAAARRLYKRHGFVERPPFAGYTDDPNSVFFELTL